jgi:hypothetical protein
MEQLPDSWVAISATQAFQFLTRQPVQSGLWLAVRRPLFVAFVLACDITLIAADPFNPRLVASATIYWAFVPLSEALALILVCWNAAERVPIPRLLDLYFTGHAPWLLWFTILSVAWSLQAPHNATTFMFIYIGVLVAGSAVAAVWSFCIDLCFFRVVMRRSQSRAALSLVIQRLISWILILVTFSWASLSAELASRLGP